VKWVRPPGAPNGSLALRDLADLENPGPERSTNRDVGDSHGRYTAWLAAPNRRPRTSTDRKIASTDAAGVLEQFG